MLKPDNTPDPVLEESQALPADLAERDARAEIKRLAGAVFEKAVERLESWPSPTASYRLQLNPGFTFSDAKEVVSYLQELGVSSIYASPVLEPNPGSMHGYDVVNHGRINPELGGEEGLRALSDALNERGMNLILDIVPNHMGVGTANAWWRDVLENGPSSRYSSFFDINWSPIKPELHNKVLIPTLGDQYGDVLERGELKLRYQDGNLSVHYWDNVFPIHPRGFSDVFRPLLPEFKTALDRDPRAYQELLSICKACDNLPPSTTKDPAEKADLLRESEVIKRRMQELVEESPAILGPIAKSLERINGNTAAPESFDSLHSLLENQSYRLAFWRVAGDQINYRRFFDINSLAAIRMEEPAVFEESHRLVMEFIGEGRVAGLRIDHPDGLSKPKEYFARLQEEFVICLCRKAHGGSESAASVAFEALEPELRERYRQECAGGDSRLASALPVYAEKILGATERLPESWAISGTTGYKFLNTLNGVFVDSESEQRFDEIYEKFTGRKQPVFDDLVYETKKFIMNTAMASQVNNLASQLTEICEANRRYRDFTTDLLRTAIVEYVAGFPVYRTYVDEGGAVSADKDYIRAAIGAAKGRSATTNASVFDFLEQVLTTEGKPGSQSEAALRLGVAMEIQQLTSPVMAKSMEDTAFYLYVRLTSLNEVGGEPQHFGNSVAVLHAENEERLRDYPGEMNTTSTHDTKRGEDVRTRIDVLSEVPALWAETLERLNVAAKPYKSEVNGRRAPDRNEEYLLYQTILGTLPFEGLRLGQVEEYTGRIQKYMEKAVKEAKVNTSWTNPNPEWEAALKKFVSGVISDQKFMEALAPLKQIVDRAGLMNSLSQLQIKLAAPGFLDVYQGCEQWNFSLVDPDNRRPVDFRELRESLKDLKTRFEAGGETRDGLVDELTTDATSGRIKQLISWRGLEHRRAHQPLYASGEYTALDARGERSDHVVAFARRLGDEAVLSISPRLVAKLDGVGGAPWEGQALELPQDLAGSRWRNIYTGVEFEAKQGGQGLPQLSLEEIFSDFPVAMLERIS